MKSPGEVLRTAPSSHEPLMKGLVAAGYQFKTPGPGSCVIISVKDSDKAEAAELAWKLHDYGYKIYGTPGTARFLNSEMVPCSVVRQMSGARPNVIDLLESGETNTDAVQETLDEAVCGINDLQEEFDENDSEIETVARECIAATVAYILEWFGIPIDTEEAIRERDW